MKKSTELFPVFAKSHPIKLKRHLHEPDVVIYCDAVNICSYCAINSSCSTTNNVGSFTTEELKEVTRIYPEYFI